MHGIISLATTVHHVKEVKQYPALALSVYYTNEKGRKRRQLIPVCDHCHNIEHDRFKNTSTKLQLNEERFE